MFAPVVTRFVTYSIPVPRFAAAYMETILDHAWMQEWIEAAQEEPWVIEQYETPQAVRGWRDPPDPGADRASGSVRTAPVLVDVAPLRVECMSMSG